MSYYFNKIVNGKFSEVIENVTEELKKEGFRILTEIDVQATFKRNLNVDFQQYRILGACNPPLAYQAIQVEDHLGTILPCNVIIQELNDGEVEVTVLDPVAYLQAIVNPELGQITRQVRTQLISVIDHLSISENSNQRKRDKNTR